jgi:hypothetical protein
MSERSKSQRWTQPSRSLVTAARILPKSRSSLTDGAAARDHDGFQLVPTCLLVAR